MPARAPRPAPTMIAIGVASPSAHGQAMISTATAFTNAYAKRGCGPQMSHARNVSPEAAITAGTNTPATRSASRWMGARLRCASPTMRTICASTVSLPTRSARISMVPVPFTVAPTRRAPDIFSTGIGSPVSIDSSTVLAPSSTTPSTGIFSPGRTRSRSPTRTRSRGISRSAPPSSTRRVMRGERSSRARIALPVCPRARNSSTCPTRTKMVIAAAASK